MRRKQTGGLLAPATRLGQGSRKKTRNRLARGPKACKRAKGPKHQEPKTKKNKGLKTKPYHKDQTKQTPRTENKALSAEGLFSPSSLPRWRRASSTGPCIDERTNDSKLGSWLTVGLKDPHLENKRSYPPFYSSIIWDVPFVKWGTCNPPLDL